MGRQRGEQQTAPAEKTCASCGRRIEWRKKWERDWDQVKYCSDACRRHGVDATDEALETSVLDLLARRSGGSTICPSEAARAVHAARPGAADDPDGWRELMEPARRAARRLVAAGEVEITQGGQVVDPSTAKGAIRIRRVR
ncbi:DUF3253 domain-containing protein [Nocardioides perillae]|uniref:DUF2256 and DUF3253 domain-containing protein n=1 Tax=Nocardioides perillae TaxID=1119534 RepID=A0A7Y9RVQ5_9ACTN|nr:hypothetical protein [Nocardioides perillae]